MNLGATIKYSREIRKMSRSQLAFAAEMSGTTIRDIEENETEPRLVIVEAIAEALDIPLSVLVLVAADKADITELTPSHVDELEKNIVNLMADVLPERGSNE